MTKPNTNPCCDFDVESLVDDKLFKALGHPNRAKLFSVLCQCDCAQTVGELQTCCDIDLSVVSRHLTMLKDANLVEAVQDGQKRRYSPRRESVVSWLRQLADAIEASANPGEENE